VVVRTVWLAFVFLIAIGGLIAYKIGFATPAIHRTASAGQPAAIVETPDTPLAKADRLDVNCLEDAPDKTQVRTIPIVLSEPAAIIQPEKLQKSSAVTGMKVTQVSPKLI
jgi:hypothetical protein